MPLTLKPRLTRHRQIRLAGLMTLLLASTPGYTAMQVVTLQHRPATLLVPELEAVAAETSVTASGNRLILNGDGGEITKLVGLIRELDQPLAQFRIHVRQSGTDSRQAGQWHVNGQLKTTTRPGTQIRTNRDRSSGSFTLHSSSSTHRVSSSVGHINSRSSRGSTQQVRALEGMPAYIETGQEIPFLSQYFGPQGHSQQQQYQPVVTGFYVTPSPAWSDQVQLDIAVRDERFSGDRDNTINTRGMATSVRVPLGQWIDLGNSLQQRARDGRSYSGHSSGQRSDSYRVELLIERSN